ncbi:MAG TPA: hypothetical protein VE621_13345, partial [Bryobacteraceae bacterium]|nr:hypothetical protein [Bryobacteraceae bacterium]
MIRLIPAQQTAFRYLHHAMKAGNLLALIAPPGRGRTTVLRKLQSELGGSFVSSKDFIEASGNRHPLSLEETLYSSVLAAMEGEDLIFVDDLDLIHDATSSCHFYPRGNYLETAILELCEVALRENKKLIVSSDGAIAVTFAARCFQTSIGKYSVEDYAALLEIFTGREQSSKLDVDQIYRFAPKLNAHQFRAACDWLRPDGEFTTEQFVDYLRSQRLASNVDLGEVQQVDLHDLQGVDDVVRMLEIHIV